MTQLWMCELRAMLEKVGTKRPIPCNKPLPIRLASEVMPFLPDTYEGEAQPTPRWLHVMECPD